MQPTRPQTSTLRTMLAVLALALVIAFVTSTTLVLAAGSAPPAWNNVFALDAASAATASGY